MYSSTPRWPAGARFCAYLRKSRDDEARERVDGTDVLEHHKRTLESLASAMGIGIDRWYRDGIVSGDSIADRPEMRTMLADVMAGKWAGCLTMEVERLSRGDAADQAAVGNAFRWTGTWILTPFKLYDPASDADMEYFEFGLFQSRREYRSINKRLVWGRNAHVADGQYIAKDAPFGYDKAVIDGMRTLVPNSDAETVRMIWGLYADGESYRAIASRLDAMGVPPARSRFGWNPASVRNIVLNDVYLGKVRWNTYNLRTVVENGRPVKRQVPNEKPDVYDGLHEAIIPPELAERVRGRTDAAPVRGDYEMRNPYGRLLVCSRCGIALRYSRKSGDRAVEEPRLNHLSRRGCNMRGAKKCDVDAVVARSLSAIAADLEAEAGSDRAAERAARREAEAARLRGEAERARRTVAENFDRMERGVISERDFVERRAVLEERAKAAEDALAAMPADDPAAGAAKAVRIRELLSMMEDPSTPVRAVAAAVRSLIERIEYTNESGWNSADGIHLDIFLR